MASNDLSALLCLVLLRIAGFSEVYSLGFNAQKGPPQEMETAHIRTTYQSEEKKTGAVWLCAHAEKCEIHYCAETQTGSSFTFK